jgi:hypothetical protein
MKYFIFQGRIIWYYSYQKGGYDMNCQIRNRVSLNINGFMIAGWY